MPLLNMPCEVRQHILYCAVASVVTPPACPSSSQVGRQSVSNDDFRGRGIWNLAPQNPALPLLLVSRQIRNEVEDILRRLPTDYHVDIMYVKQYGLWTTWSVPILPRTRYINSVRATVRIFEPTDDLDPKFKNSLSFQGGDGGPETAVWAFYSLIVVLLHKGPGYMSRRLLAGARPPYIVKEIAVDVLAPTDGYAHNSIVLTDRECAGSTPYMRNARQLNDRSKAPEQRLVEYMTRNLDMVLALGYHTAAYGMIIAGNVSERIVFRRNGTEHHQWDMGRVMQAHELSYWGETPKDIAERKERYRTWRIWLDERRRRMQDGLEVDDDDRPVSFIM